MESNFVATSSSIKHVYRRCQKPFLFKNALYRHLRADHYNKKDINVSIAESLIPMSEPHSSSTDPTCESPEDSAMKGADDSSKIVYSISTDRPITGYAFRGFHYVTAMIQFFLLGILYDLCFDTRCIMSLIDRAFLREVYPDAEIKRMSTLMTVKGIGSRKHNASEYVKLKMYLSDKNGTAVIERELHIVDDLTVRALIDIDIMKPERIVVDLGNDFMKVGACQDIEVPIVAVAKGAPISRTVYSSKRVIIPAQSNVAVPISGSGKALDLPDDRDLLFESQTLDALSVYAHIVDHEVFKVFVRNGSDKLITLPRKQKLGRITDYDASSYCYAV